MPIDAKIVDAAKNVVTVTFSNDEPDDIDMIFALGGSDGDDVHSLGYVGEWEVLAITNGKDRLLR